MYSNFDDVQNLFWIAALKEHTAPRSFHNFSKVIGRKAVKAEEQAVDRLPNESIWISNSSIFLT
jgi:hypothetical protein